MGADICAHVRYGPKADMRRWGRTEVPAGCHERIDLPSHLLLPYAQSPTCRVRAFGFGHKFRGSPSPLALARALCRCSALRIWVCDLGR